MEELMREKNNMDGLLGYLAKPTSIGPWPCLIVIQEWWGLDPQTKSIADRFAALGYLAFSPDLYHGELAQLGDSEKAMQLVQKYGPTASLDTQQVFDTLKNHPDSTGKVGSVGFCFGGRMSLLLGVNRPVDAVCTFYGGGMQQIFEQLANLHCPVLGLFGDQDASIPVGTVEQFDHLLDRIGVEHEVVVYPNSGHAFFRDSDLNVFKPEAAKDAWIRVTSFFGKHLR
jgi:carboxymethylenebutenolidase